MTPPAMDPQALGELLGYLTPEERRLFDSVIAHAAKAQAAPPPMSFRAFVGECNPRFQWYRHCVELADVLQRVADDHQAVLDGRLSEAEALNRVIIEEPPRHGKSEEVSRLFSAYWLYRFPFEWVALATYAAELAYTLSRSARENYRRAVGEVSDDAAAVKHWETGKGGGLWAAGAGGPATGKGGHLLIIDDPTKNAEEAASETIGAKLKDWYGSTWYTRQEPYAVFIVMHTRWPGPGDLIGWLLEEEAGEEPEGWYIVHLEAIKEDETVAIPATCTLHPDWRQPGEALCPERYPLAKLKKIAARIGEFFFRALFQQRPTSRKGAMFPRDKAQILDAAPVGLRWLRYWDKAGTEGAGALTASVKMAIDPDGLIWISDVVMDQVASLGRRKLMRSVAVMDGHEVQVWMEQEPGSGGKESAELSVLDLGGYSARYETVTGDKITRADPLSAQWQAGNVRLVRGEWNSRYLDLMAAFPHGKFKDPTDASSGAYNKLAGNRPFFIV